MFPDQLINFNKPRGVSSAFAIKILKRLLGVSKIGYAGTLDPFATGVLVVGTNQATKQLATWNDAPKTYVVKILFGISTDAADLTGTVNAMNYHPFSQQQLTAALLAFMNQPYWQTPPAYSAIKHHGIRAYEYARANVAIDLAPRIMVIHAIKLLTFDFPVARVELSVSKGFYVRQFVVDLAQQLETVAVALELVRTACGSYNLATAKTLTDFGFKYAHK